jgi:polar amino acid transport system substrate-binding protein
MWLSSVGLGSAYDLYLTRTLKHATIIRAKVGGGQASIDLFYEQKPDAAAGVRQALVAHAKKDINVRVARRPVVPPRRALCATSSRR